MYVHVLPSAEPFHDSASPGMGEKSFGDLSVTVAYWMFHASYEGTLTPTSGFMLSMFCVSPAVKTTGLVALWAGDGAAPASSASSNIEAARVRVDGAQGATISIRSGKCQVLT